MSKSIIFLSILASATAIYVAIPSDSVGVHVWMGQQYDELQHGVVFYNPLFSKVHIVKTEQDTDEVLNVRCVSKEGVNIEIPSIQTANRIRRSRVLSTFYKYGPDYDKKLVTEQLGQLVREFCAENTLDQIEITEFKNLNDQLRAAVQKHNDDLDTGVEVDWVRIMNIKVPDTIKQKRLELAAEKANRILAEERKNRVAIEKETEAIIQQADNERFLSATRREVEQITLLANANSESTRLEALGLAKLYEIPGYAEVLKVQALAGNMKVYFGDHLPGNMFLGAPTGALPLDVPGSVPVPTMPLPPQVLKV